MHSGVQWAIKYSIFWQITGLLTVTELRLLFNGFLAWDCLTSRWGFVFKTE